MIRILYYNLIIVLHNNETYAVDSPTNSFVQASFVTDLDYLSYYNLAGQYGDISNIIKYNLPPYSGPDVLAWDPYPFQVDTYHLLFTFPGNRIITSVQIYFIDDVHTASYCNMYSSQGGTLVGSISSPSPTAVFSITRQTYSTLYLELGGPDSGYQVTIYRILFYQ